MQTARCTGTSIGDRMDDRITILRQVDHDVVGRRYAGALLGVVLKTSNTVALAQQFLQSPKKNVGVTFTVIDQADPRASQRGKAWGELILNRLIFGARMDESQGFFGSGQGRSLLKLNGAVEYGPLKPTFPDRY